jgi:3-oxosteroid 1-dehydrogenase
MTFDPPRPFDSAVTEADVIVVGSGGSGLTAAIVSAAGGASVVVLEKAAQLGGTTALSGGGVWAPLNPHEAAAGVQDSYDDVLTYLRAIAGAGSDDSLLVAYAKNAAAMISFLEEEGGLSFRAYPGQGTTWDYRSDEPGARRGGRGVDSGPVQLGPLGTWADLIRMGRQSAWVFDKFVYYANSMHALPPAASARPVPTAQDITAGAAGRRPKDVVANGTALVAQLLRGCLEQGVQVFASAPVGDLVIEAGRVVGVQVDAGGGSRVVRAHRGVVIATGGFTHNSELLKKYLPDKTIDYTCDVESNEGDGLLMGIRAGAAVANTGDAWWIPSYFYSDPGAAEPQGSMTREDRCLPHTMMVNNQGRRFVNEAQNYYDIVAAFEPAGGPSNLPAWMIFDAQATRKYSLLRAAPWPSDGSTPSWLLSGDTLGELAAQCAIPAAELEQTVAQFNEAAAQGIDPLFHRGESQWDLAWGDAANEPNPSLGPVAVAPFYALKLTSGAFSTKGGLKINDRGQVVAEPTGEPIPGLYAAGNVSNDALPGGYPGVGGTLGPAMTFAYLIGRQLAAGRNRHEEQESHA